MKALIIEDELPAYRRLQKLLEEVYPSLTYYLQLSTFLLECTIFFSQTEEPLGRNTYPNNLKHALRTISPWKILHLPRNSCY